MFETLRQHHALAGDRVVGNYDFAEGDAHAKLWPNFVIEAPVKLMLRRQEGQGGGNGVGGPLEFGQQRIAAKFVHLAAISRNGIAESPERIPDTLVGKTFIALHQRRRAHDISMQNYRQLAG